MADQGFTYEPVANNTTPLNEIRALLRRSRLYMQVALYHEPKLTKHVVRDFIAYLDAVGERLDKVSLAHRAAAKAERERVA